MEQGRQQSNGDHKLPLLPQRNVTPKVRVTLTYWVSRKDGSEGPRVTVESESLLRNFLRMVGGVISSGLMASSFAVLDTSGASRTATTSSGNQGNTTLNKPTLHCGSGITAVDLLDYALVTELDTVVATGVQEATDGTTYSITWTGGILNDSGDAWSVKEVGMSVNINYATVAYDVLMLRDVLAATVSVPDGDTFNLQYSLETTA